MQIFISGCAKTRTTLVQWLFTAFKDCVVFPGELPLETFRQSNLRYFPVNMVIKRTIDSIFAHALSADKYKDQICRIKVDGIKVVRVTRNREDTLKSDNGYVSADRYDACEQQAKNWADLITYTLNSDRLIAEPDAVQKEVADALGLEIVHRWSEWPKFVPKQQMQYTMYDKIFNPLGVNNAG